MASTHSSPVFTLMTFLWIRRLSLLSGSHSLSLADPQGEGMQVPAPGVGSIYMYYLEFFSKEDFPFPFISLLNHLLQRKLSF